MQGGWNPPPGGGGGGYGPPGGYGQPPPGPGGAYGGSPYGAGSAPQAPPGAQPPPGMFPGGPASPGYGTYEFNAAENDVIARTAARAKLWGMISAVFGAFQLLGSCGMVANAGLAMYLPLGIIGLVVGVTFMGVGSSLRSVVDTQGSDMPHMMQALQKLTQAFTVQIVATIVGVVIGAIVLFIGLFFLAAAAASSPH